MDYSKKYIKMCEKAWHIIGIPDYEPTTGRYINNQLYEIDEFGYYWWKSEFESRIPLYRQDQLQDMVINFGYGHQNAGILVGLSLFSGKHGYNNASMEQLWLAFVMHEKYGKVWNEEKEEWRVK